MRLFKPINKSDVVAIAFKPESITYSLIQSDNGKAPVSIKAFKHVPLNNFELTQQIIFNPTCISKHINSFFDTYKIKDVPVRISLQGATIFEQFFTIAGTDICPETLKNPQLKDIIWQETLITRHPHQSMYYVCGISRHQLLQYKLLAFKHQLPVECISTHTLSLLSAYHALHNDMPLLDNDNVDIEKIMSLQSIQPLVVNLSKEQDSLLMTELIGLAIAGIFYENI